MGWLLIGERICSSFLKASPHSMILDFGSLLLVRISRMFFKIISWTKHIKSETFCTIQHLHSGTLLCDSHATSKRLCPIVGSLHAMQCSSAFYFLYQKIMRCEGWHQVPLHYEICFNTWVSGSTLIHRVDELRNANCIFQNLNIFP